jgi:hypothetical protein
LPKNGGYCLFIASLYLRSAIHIASLHLPLYLRDRRTGARVTPMLDLILLISGLAFFTLSIGYAFACERL